MKKLIFLTFFVLSTFVLFAQEPPYTPMKGNYKFKGVKCDSLFLVPSFSDTTAANATYLDSVPGAMIRCGNDFFMRNANTSAWLQNVNVGDGANPVLYGLNSVLNNGNIGYNNDIQLVNNGWPTRVKLFSDTDTLIATSAAGLRVSTTYSGENQEIRLKTDKDQESSSLNFENNWSVLEINQNNYNTGNGNSGINSYTKNPGVANFLNITSTNYTKYSLIRLIASYGDSSKIDIIADSFRIHSDIVIDSVDNTTEFDNLLVEKNNVVYKKQTPKVLVLGNVSQSGSSDPTFDILENTTGVPNGDISMVRIAQGSYQVQAASGTPFTTGKVGVLLSSTNANADSVYDYDFSSSTAIYFRSANGSGTATDSLFLNATIEIKIYP